MPSILITTPRREMANAAAEAADVLAAGAGEYFRHFYLWQNPDIKPGERVFYVEDGYIRGFAVATRTKPESGYVRCVTTGRVWERGFYVFMDATTWTWIRPIPFTGFQGFRYIVALMPKPDKAGQIYLPGTEWIEPLEIIGGWKDPRPVAPGDKVMAPPNEERLPLLDAGKGRL
jgi:hypothetical protein